MPNDLSQIRFEGLAGDYPAGTRIDMHEHDTHQIVHAIEGALRVEAGAGVWVVPPGRALWMPAGHPHAIDCRSDTQMRTVYIDARLASMPEAPAVWTVTPLLREILVRFATVENPAGAGHLKAMLLEEAGSAPRLPLNLPMPREPRLKRLADSIVDDPADTHELADWARRLGFSERSLIRHFQSETGMTFRHWRRQARLLAAIQQLTAGRSVTDAAIESGYRSVSAFIKAFRQSFGETPRRYFELHRPGDD